MADRTLTYFISDLHLGASYIPDPKAHEQRIVAFLDSIAPTCRRLILLGDILDFWWEYRTVVPRGFVRFFGALARMADSGVEIIWHKGNHDIWFTDYLPREIGFQLRDGVQIMELDGKRFLLEHGDGVGRLPRTFRMLRRLFRSRKAQRLYSAIHPRWALGFAHSWSSHSRKNGGYTPPANAADRLREFAQNYNANHPNGKIDYFIFGHCHLLIDKTLPDGSTLVVLGDWINQNSYAIWDGNSLSIHTFDRQIPLINTF